MIFELSDPTLSGKLLGGRSYDIASLDDFESGGDDINDLTHGKQSQIWNGYYRDYHVYIQNPNIEPVKLFSGTDISTLSFTFDQLMRPVLVITQGDVIKLRWYDSTISDYTITDFIAGETFPCVSLDDKRGSQDDTSDVIFAYIRGSNLCYRAQRDRYEIEYLLETKIYHKLEKIGMNTQWRMQFVLI